MRPFVWGQGVNGRPMRKARCDRAPRGRRHPRRAWRPAEYSIAPVRARDFLCLHPCCFPTRFRRFERVYETGQAEGTGTGSGAGTAQGPVPIPGETGDGHDGSLRSRPTFRLGFPSRTPSQQPISRADHSSQSEPSRHGLLTAPHAGCPEVVQSRRSTSPAVDDEPWRGMWRRMARSMNGGRPHRGGRLSWGRGMPRAVEPNVANTLFGVFGNAGRLAEGDEECRSLEERRRLARTLGLGPAEPVGAISRRGVAPRLVGTAGSPVARIAAEVIAFTRAAVPAILTILGSYKGQKSSSAPGQDERRVDRGWHGGIGPPDGLPDDLVEDQVVGAVLDLQV